MGLMSRGVVVRSLSRSIPFTCSAQQLFQSRDTLFKAFLLGTCAGRERADNLELVPPDEVEFSDESLDLLATE